MRLFVAAWPPPEVARALESLAHSLARQAPGMTLRPTSAAQCHLTIRFLGDVVMPPAALDALSCRLRDASSGIGAFQVHGDRLGRFPESGTPRVVWAGLGGDLQPLAQLHARIAEATLPFAPAPTPIPAAFVPHITIARSTPRPPRAPGPDRRRTPRSAANAIDALLDGASLPTTGPWWIREVRLIQSDLRPDGARYTVLGEFSLAEARPPTPRAPVQDESPSTPAG